MVNAQEIQGSWNQLRGKVKEKWGQLTDDDLTLHGGNVDQLIGKIQQKTGAAREAVETFFGDLTKNTSGTVAKVAEQAKNLAAEAGEKLAPAVDRLKDEYSQAAEKARQGYEQAEDLVRQKPGQSVAAAFGFGLVLGVVVCIALKPSR